MKYTCTSEVNSVLFTLHCGKVCFPVFIRIMQNMTCLDSYDCRNNCAFTSFLLTHTHVSKSQWGEYEPFGLLHATLGISIAVVYIPILVSVVNS